MIPALPQINVRMASVGFYRHTSPQFVRAFGNLVYTKYE